MTSTTLPQDGQPGNGDPAELPPASVEARMTRAVNDGIDFVTEQLDLGERDADLANIIGHAIGTAWRTQAKPAAWPEFIAENFSAGPGPEDDPATWWDFAPSAASTASSPETAAPVNQPPPLQEDRYLTRDC
jgi:hypothetical protein